MNVLTALCYLSLFKLIGLAIAIRFVIYNYHVIIYSLYFLKYVSFVNGR